MRIISSEEVKKRLQLAQQGAGTIPVVADLDLLSKHPQAAILHGIFLWISFQQDAEQHISTEDIRKNVLGWSRDKFYRALNILQELGYLQRQSTPSKGTILRVYVLPAGDYSENRNKLFRKSEQTAQEKSLPEPFLQALNNININNTLNIDEFGEKILSEYIHLKVQIAGAAVRNADAFQRYIWKDIVEGNIDEDILLRAAKRVLFPPGTYVVSGGVVEWNGEKGIFRDETGKVLQILTELPADARRVGEDK